MKRLPPPASASLCSQTLTARECARASGRQMLISNIASIFLLFFDGEVSVYAYCSKKKRRLDCRGVGLVSGSLRLAHFRRGLLVMVRRGGGGGGVWRRVEVHAVVAQSPVARERLPLLGILLQLVLAGDSGLVLRRRGR